VVLHLDGVALFQKGNEFHDAGGVDDAEFQKGVAIGEVLARLAKQEVFNYELPQFVVERHVRSSGLQNDLRTDESKAEWRRCQPIPCCP